MLAIVHLLLTVLTNFKAGVFKLIPFKVHGYIELIVAVALIAIAFYFGNTEGNMARNFYIGFGIAVFLTWLLTDYNS